jgi:diaminohydroxyphosphoribosylaminopyrimidine deaminase / 5-amino-6-(5-phosphoribosylamino)uracil reductase
MFFLLTLLLSLPPSVDTPMPSDLQFMHRALALAERGRGFVSPNPLVGCILAKAGKTVAEGWHEVLGGPHAEAMALKKAGPRAKGTTAYVTLEPCSHWGKTPPCADALIRSGVRRVVAAVRDPHRKVSGRGFAALRKAGLRVDTGLLEKEARHQNRAFFKANTTGLPYVIWKSGQTLDGKIASHTGASRWITGPEARSLAHRLRAESDAILVGGNTARRDNPVLTAHGHGPDPVKLILSASLDLSPRLRLFKEGTTLILTRKNPPAARVKALKSAGALILKFFVKFDKIELINCFRYLSEIGLQQILLEGGGETSAALLGAGLVDEVYHAISLQYLGGRNAKTSLEGTGWATPGKGPRLSAAESFQVGEDLVVHGFTSPSSRLPSP